MYSMTFKFNWNFTIRFKGFVTFKNMYGFGFSDYVKKYPVDTFLVNKVISKEFNISVVVINSIYVGTVAK